MEGAFHPFGARPAHLVVAHRRLVEVGRIPVERQAPGKVPAAILADIIVDIHHLHDDPFVRPALDRGLVLVLRIDHAVGMIGIVEFDHVAADMVRGTGKGRTQRAVHIGPQRLAAAGILAHADIGREQRNHRVHIAHVEREGIFGGQLADRIERFQAVDPGFKRGHGHTLCRMVRKGKVTVRSVRSAAGCSCHPALPGVAGKAA